MNTNSGENTWNFLVIKNEPIINAFTFNSSVLFLGEERNCCVSPEKSIEKLTGSIESMPKKIVDSSVWRGVTTKITNFPVGTYILDFNVVSD